MRIVFDMAALWRGGAERQTLDLAARLSERGHEVLFIVNKHAEYFAEYMDRVDILELGRTDRWDVRVVADIRHALRAFGADVCVCVMFNASLWGRLAAASLGISVVVAEHSTTDAPRAVERLTNLSLAGVTEAVIACADAQVEALVRSGHPRSKIHVVHNGVDTTRFAPDIEGARTMRAGLGLPSDAPVVMLVAAHRAEKRHDRFIQLIERLNEMEIPASGVMVGGGPSLEHTEALAAASTVHDRLRVTGPVTDMPAAYSAADVVVLLSDNIETFPLSFLEAQACAVPVVGMDTGGVHETMLDGQTGHVVGAGDLDAMASTVAGLLLDRTLRMEMGRAGRAFVQDRLSSEGTVEGYLRILEGRDD